MLTEAEIEWLERRKKLCARCARYSFCKIGNKHVFKTERCRFWEALNPKGEPLVRNYFRESAEFEASVQKWLIYQYEKVFQCKDVSGGFMPSRETMLMFARLAAEAEMDSRE